MTTFSAETLATLRATFKKSSYLKKEWTVKMAISLREYAEEIDPTLCHMEGDPIIIAKVRKDGNIFLKMAISIEGGSVMEFDLSYRKDFQNTVLSEYTNSFEEGDEIDASTLQFGVESYLGKEHGFVVGKVKE